MTYANIFKQCKHIYLSYLYALANTYYLGYYRMHIILQYIIHTHMATGEYEKA